MEQVVSEERALKMILLPWRLILTDGILVVLLGVLLIIDPQSTLTLLVKFLGAYWFISGIFQLAASFNVRKIQTAS